MYICAKKFIPRFAELSTPLTNLTRGCYPKKSSPVKWLEKHQKAFEEIKKKLTNSPLLKHFNPRLKIVIWTDDSKIGIAGTLLQKSSDDEYIHPVSYISQRINQCEKKYSAIELELLAIVYVMEQFRTYTYGQSVEIWTDHVPLRYLNNIKTFSTYVQTSPKISGSPFERFTIDFIGPISPSSNGCSYILLGICATTNYAVAKPYKKADGRTTVNFLIDIISQYGAISEVHSDRGLHFTNNLVKDLLTTLNIKNTFSIAYRPLSQGQTEKFNGTLIDMISHFVQEKPQNWSQIIKYLLFGYNSSKNETTGYSPFFFTSCISFKIYF
ncbi:hypothetical protein QTP88_011368 [Uroleucon formosanum]